VRKNRLIVVGTTATLAVVWAAAPAAAAPTDDTVVTFDVAAGTLDVDAPAAANLGAGAPDTVITGTIGPVTVTDGRAAADASWVASASSTDFTTGAETPAETIAVGLIIALYFQKIIDALLNGVLLPIISAIFGKPDFTEIGFDIGKARISIGLVLNAVVSFVVVAALLFFIVLAYNRMRATKTKDEADTELSVLREIRDSDSARIKHRRVAEGTDEEVPYEKRKAERKREQQKQEDNRERDNPTDGENQDRKKKKQENQLILINY